jgi:hypothetical protein
LFLKVHKALKTKERNDSAAGIIIRPRVALQRVRYIRSLQCMILPHVSHWNRSPIDR